MKSVFVRVVDADDKASGLRQAIQDSNLLSLEPSQFSEIPGSPFAYWTSNSIRSLFRTLPQFEAEGRTSKHGAATLDDFRFVRLAFEPSMGFGRWKLFVKGGSYSRFYWDVATLLAWARDGSEVKSFVEAKVGSASRTIQATAFYFKPGFTWPLRGIRFSTQAVGSGCIFSVAGKMAFVADDDRGFFLALLNSMAFDALIRLSAGKVGGVQYETGMIARIPVPTVSTSHRRQLASLASDAWSLKRSLDTRTETSHAFVLPAQLQVDGPTLTARSGAWTERVRAVEAELAAIQAEIDDRCFALYGIDDEDRRAITEGFGSGMAADSGDEDAEPGGDAEEDEAEAAADATTLAAELVSWAVGVAFGRFDVRLATGERPLPAEPEPFDPLPVCSPGMLTGDDGLPLPRPPVGYPIAFPEDGVLVDDPGHDRDLVARVRQVFEVVFGASADAMWQEASALLSPRDGDLRSWLASGFFEHHLKRHSKSRRKAPVLWQLGVLSGRYSVWAYAHRMGRDSLLAIGRELVDPRVATEERRLSSLRAQAGPNPSARDRAEIATHEALLEELRTFADEVRRVAPLWDPDLDDGIVLVMAPLWRLVPGHRAWQKELRTKWDELCAGKYDWAHLSMHLWPERVVPKCATDRSLAIAHDLGGVFWVEGVDGKWTRRPQPTRSIGDLVEQRTSAAVKAALACLLEAPALVAAGGRGRRKGG